MQEFVYVNLFKHSQHGNRVHSRYDGAEQQTGQELQLAKFHLESTHSIQQAADKEGVPQSTHNSKHQDRAQVFHEGTNGQKIARVQDDGRQQAEKEQIGVHDRGHIFSSQSNEPTNQQTHDDKKAALWHDVGETGNQMKPWEQENTILKDLLWQIKMHNHLFITLVKARVIAEFVLSLFFTKHSSEGETRLIKEKSDLEI